MYIGKKGGKITRNAMEGATMSGRLATVLNAVETMEKFPCVRLEPDEEAVFQREAGYLNPRKIVGKCRPFNILTSMESITCCLCADPSRAHCC